MDTECAVPGEKPYVEDVGCLSHRYSSSCEQQKRIKDEPMAILEGQRSRDTLIHGSSTLYCAIVVRSTN